MPAHPIADLAEDRHALLGDPVGRRPVGDHEVVDALGSAAYPAAIDCRPGRSPSLVSRR
jgi:hypothetical protein